MNKNDNDYLDRYLIGKSNNVIYDATQIREWLSSGEHDIIQKAFKLKFSETPFGLHRIGDRMDVYFCSLLYAPMMVCVKSIHYIKYQEILREKTLDQLL